MTPDNTSRHELVAWVVSNGRLPSTTKNPARAEEARLSHKLFRLRKSHRNGVAKLHQLELLLSIPGCLDGQERSDAVDRAAELRAHRDTVEAAKALTLQARVSAETTRWEASFGELQQWVASSGAVPRRRTGDAQEYKVANWLNIQRTHARNGTLAEGREAKLRTIHGALETKQARPSHERIADIAAFQAKHERLPSSTAHGQDEVRLARFLHQIRSRIHSGYFSAGLTAALTTEAQRIPGFFTGRGSRP